MPATPLPTLRAIAQDLDIEHVKPTRRAAAPAAAAEHSSDHSEDTGIEGTDAPENATARPASRGKAAPRKGAPAPDTKAASSGSDEDSAAATPKLAKAAKVTAQAKKKETPAGKTEEVAVRQRPTNNQLLCVSRDARALRAAKTPPRDRPDRRVACLVVEFRHRAAPRASARRAPEPRFPADHHPPRLFRAPARSCIVAASDCRSRRYKARFNWEHYTHAVAPGTREMLPSETQACASVTSAFLQVRPNRDRRATTDASHTRGGVSFFGAFRGLRVRSLSRPSVTRKSRDRVPERDRRARRARPRALDRARRSIALGRSRARRPDRPESRLPASRARAPPPPPPRDADRGGCLSARFDAARNNTHLRFGEIARSRRKEKKKTASDDFSSPPRALLLTPRLLTTTRLTPPPGSQGDSRRRDSARPRREEHPEAAFREHQAHEGCGSFHRYAPRPG